MLSRCNNATADGAFPFRPVDAGGGETERKIMFQAREVSFDARKAYRRERKSGLRKMLNCSD